MGIEMGSRLHLLLCIRRGRRREVKDVRERLIHS
jgi:hypothetical protein